MTAASRNPALGLLLTAMLAPAVLSCRNDSPVQLKLDQINAGPTPRPEVELVLGTWRGEDVQEMNRLLAAFNRVNPDIRIRYDPVLNTEYNAVLDARLAAGSGPDLMYLRSFGISRILWDKGYLADLSDLPGLRDRFPPEALTPWTAANGTCYGVPFIATSHGIYYNKDRFARLGLAIPRSWPELLQVAARLKQAGIIPFANASGDPWTLAELLFMNIAPSFIGGRAGRLAYLDGRRSLDDALMTAVFQAIKDLKPWLPPQQIDLRYVDSENLFATGQAAMMFGGSWQIAAIEKLQPAFDWGVFGVPPPAGQTPGITFQPDAALGINARTPHLAEARRFVEWSTSPECARLLSDELPGFFPMVQEPPRPKNPHTAEFLALNQGRDTDIRFAWETLMDGQPSAYQLIQDGAFGVLNNGLAPQEAARQLKAGLAVWFWPARASRSPAP